MSLPKPDKLPEQLEVKGLPNRAPSILPFRIPRWPLWVWFIIAVAALPFVAMPLMGIARYTTTSPQYCATCHGTGETPDRAVKSVVHPDFDRVTCVDCHAKPGGLQVVFEGYSRGFMAEPERVTSNCLRCHEGIASKNDQDGFKFNFLEIKIPHKLHLDQGASCTSCHSNIAHDLNTPQTNRPTMNACYSCHATSDTCNKCHAASIPSAPEPVPAPATLGSMVDGRVLYQRVCSACHGQKGDRLRQANLSSEEFLVARGDERLFKDTAEGIGVMPAFSKERGGTLTNDEIRAALGYLKTLARGAAASKIDAKAMYEKNCIVCHGANGDKIAGVKHSSREFWYARGEDAIAKAITNGKGGMPPFGKGRGGSMTPVEVTAIVEYLKTFRGTADAASAGGASEEGKKVFAGSCAGCHGAKGDSLPTSNFSAKDFFASRTEADLIKATAEGKGGMPPLGKAKGGPLTDEQVKQVVDYLKTLAVQ